MTLARKNSINKNVAFEIEKSMVFLIPFSNCELLLKSNKNDGKKLYSSNQGKAENFHLEVSTVHNRIYEKLRRTQFLQVETRKFSQYKSKAQN
jgi:hypothetical protein